MKGGGAHPAYRKLADVACIIAFQKFALVVFFSTMCLDDLTCSGAFSEGIVIPYQKKNFPDGQSISNVTRVIVLHIIIASPAPDVKH